jgi:hypothetical protein
MTFESRSHSCGRPTVAAGSSYRLCYVRGPNGIIVALAEQLR